MPTETTDSATALFVESFEEGLGRWAVETDSLQRTDAVAYDGEYYAAITDTSEFTTLATTAIDLDERLSSISYYWQETSRSYGGGLRVFDGEGNPEIGAATDNPQWVVSSGNGVDRIGRGVEYRTWVRTTIEFDQSGGRARVSFESTSGDESESTVVPLQQGNGVGSLRLSAYTDRYGWKNSSCHKAWGRIVVRE